MAHHLTTIHGGMPGKQYALIFTFFSEQILL
jgi:hypothetical protein